MDGYANIISMLDPNKIQISENKKSHKGIKMVGALALVVASGGVSAVAAGASTHAAQGSSIKAEANFKKTTPPRELVREITALDKGGQVDVTATEVKIPGPVGGAGGRPIIYEDGKGGNYYAAYTQGHEPDFKLTPSETASTMAIVDLGPNYQEQVVGAHLNKLGELVTVDNTQTVGYSVGGDKGK